MIAAPPGRGTLFLCALLSALAASPALAGVLPGRVVYGGAVAVVEDIVQLPASAASGPIARINVLREAPDGSGRLFVNDMRGPLTVIDGASFHTYLDLAALRPDLKTTPGLGEGFVSFAFHPAFASNGIFYTVHSAFVGSILPTHEPAVPTSIDQHSVLTEWTAADPASNSFSGSSRELIRIAAPHRFHNMGEIAFDPNAQPGDADYGLLYVGSGDFGSVALGEPQQLQRLDTLLGAVLRIDPLGGSGAPYSYGIPPGNPYANDGDPATLGEIYAHGFRNAHRIAWDAAGPGPPLVSEIGEDNVEEIDVLVAGANYGWPAREGTFALDVSTDPGTVFELPADDADFGYSYPVAQYDHGEGSAIAGGFVYRAEPASPLYGKFVFGDIVNGRIFYADHAEMLAADDADPATTARIYELWLRHRGAPATLLDIVRAELAQPTLARVDLRFATDLAGNLYVTTKQDGYIRRLDPSPSISALPGAAPLALAAALLATAWVGAYIAKERRPIQR